MKPLDEPIYVTQPILPPIEEISAYLEQIWENKVLTNNGPFHRQFEKELADYLGVKYISLFTNGTLALVTALQALRITGEVITTPFSFVASTHSIWWNNIKPVFADIEPNYFNLDPEKVEAAITPQTTAIMPVHVYGNPCNVDRFKELADTYGLKIIYDAAHAFCVNRNGTSILNYGDLSVMSFHATKVFNTFEGGAIICHDEATKKRIDHLKNFGFVNETTVVIPGINAKMNEFQAAMGLIQLKHVDRAIEKRREIAKYYREGIKKIEGISCLDDMEDVRHCYSYFPILVEREKYPKSRDHVYELFKEHNIFGRRYFYPLISNFQTYRGLASARPDNLPIASKVAEQVICLPIFPDMDRKVVDLVVDLLKSWS